MSVELDRISDLPDPLIHLILSFLPSAKQAIQTTVLSKRWRNQWTRSPALVFPPKLSSSEAFLKFVDNTLLLHDCSKINKFYLRYPELLRKDPGFDDKIRFATSKHVEQLTLFRSVEGELWVLPQLVFNHTCLVEFKVNCCILTPAGKVNWAHLKALGLENCKLSNQAMQLVLSGTPLLESLELIHCFGTFQLFIASRYLKRLVLIDLHADVLEILCPNLRVLIIRCLLMDDRKLFDQAIHNAVSHCLSLESLVMTSNKFGRLVIASKSLRRLRSWVLNTDGLHISCPKLEEMFLIGSVNSIDVKLMNVPSLLRATLRFILAHQGLTKENEKNLQLFMYHLQHVNELRLASSTVEIFAVVEESCRHLIYPMLSVKYMTLEIANWDKYESGIACVLGYSPMLESLDICFKYFGSLEDCDPELDSSGENNWSRKANFNCFVSHLKTVKMSGFMKRPRLVLNFLQFLLQNAQVLENLVVLVEECHPKNYRVEDFGELLSYPRCSEHVVVELSGVAKT